MGCGMYMDSSTLDRVQLADEEPNALVGCTPLIRPRRGGLSHRPTWVLVACAAVLVLASSAAATAASWRRVHVWTSHGASLTANHKLPAGDYRLIYRAKNPKTWMHVNLTCGGEQYADSYRVRAQPKTLTFRSTGCKMHVLMLGHITLDAAGMFMRLKLDRR